MIPVMLLVSFHAEMMSREIERSSISPRAGARRGAANLEQPPLHTVQQQQRRHDLLLFGVLVVSGVVIRRPDKIPLQHRLL